MEHPGPGPLKTVVYVTLYGGPLDGLETEMPRVENERGVFIDPRGIMVAGDPIAMVTEEPSAMLGEYIPAGLTDAGRRAYFWTGH